MKAACIFLLLVVFILSSCSRIESKNAAPDYINSSGMKPKINDSSAQIMMPSLKIISPQDGQIVKGPTVTIGISAFNFTAVPVGSPVKDGEGHFHVWLDSYKKISAGNVFVFENVTSGRHSVAAELVKSDHSSLSPKIMQSININVESGFVPEIKAQQPGFEEFAVEADDKDFYPNKIRAKINDTARISFKFRDDSIYFAGLDVKGPFEDVRYKLKGSQPITREFTMKGETRIDSYWPSSGVHKATLTVEAEK